MQCDTSQANLSLFRLNALSGHAHPPCRLAAFTYLFIYLFELALEKITWINTALSWLIETCAVRSRGLQDR